MFFTDDDHDDLHLMKEVSEALGQTAQFFNDGNEMLAALAGDDGVRPDLIFLDITMERIDGFEVLGALRLLGGGFSSIPVIIHSSNCDEKCISKCFDLGANYYITKALSFKALKSSIEYAINKDWVNFKATRENFLHLHSD